MTTLIVLAAALAAAQPVSTDAQALRCTAAFTVLAAMLDNGAETTEEDRLDAAWFRGRAENWRARSGPAAPAAAFEQEARALAGAVSASPDPASAQALLEARLQECDVPGAVDAAPTSAS